VTDSVLDSYALLALLFRERGHGRVVSRFERAVQEGRPLLITSVNWAEVRYMIERKLGVARWREAREKLLGLPLDVVPAGQELAEAAGAIKAAHRMSLADCFAAALARRLKADLYTGDPEFAAVENDIKIVWLRA
jgi:ribonuclease VapC